MKIKSVRINHHKKCLEVTTVKGDFSLPFSKLRLIPTPDNGFKEIYVDKELGNEGITYTLQSGEEDSVPLDGFLDYNMEPNYMRKLHLYRISLLAQEYVKESRLSKREIARKLHTSPAHLYRLLDQTNYSKTIDQMFKLLACLGHDVEIRPVA